MARKAHNIGPDTLAVVETVPTALIRALLAYREAATEPSLDGLLPPADLEDIDAFRIRLTASLDAQTAESLVPLEDRCRRVRRLSEAKGPASLAMLAEQRLSHEEHETYEAQLDPLCKSIWVFLNDDKVFEDAEAFHAARQYRDFGQMYDAFEVDVDESDTLDAASVNEEALAMRITTLLELPTKCTVRSVNLPKTRSHPASVMLIVRHPGPLSSVFSHKENGMKGTIYYRPPNGATLIWTPELRQMEICARSPIVRQKVGTGFAEVVLNQNLSSKPLTWRRYNLSRFHQSLSLPIPQRDDCQIIAAQLIEIELRLGTWSRRLALKVTVDDDIELIAKRYLGSSDIFRRAEGFSRIIIAVKYVRLGESKERALNLSIGSNRSNVQSIRDPDDRSLGFALLDHWGMLNAFRQLDDTEAWAILPQLLELNDLPEDEVSGGFLHGFGLDPQRLIKAGIIDLRGRQKVILIDEDDDFGEVTIAASGHKGIVTATGLHGEDLGMRSAEDVARYVLKREWLDETILKLVKPLMSRPAIQILDADLAYLGLTKLNGDEVPAYFARRLGHPATISRLDLILRGRQGLGVGIVLASGPSELNHLGPNVVVRLADYLAVDQGGHLSTDGLEQVFRAGRDMAFGGASIVLVKSGPQSATLHVPGLSSLALHSRIQIQIFELLIAAHMKGSPEVKASQLLEGSNVRSPGDAFPSSMRASVVGHYLEKSTHKGFWHLKV